MDIDFRNGQKYPSVVLACEVKACLERILFCLYTRLGIISKH